MHESLVNKYLTGRRTPPPDFYDKTANILQVPVALLRPTGADETRAVA